MISQEINVLDAVESHRKLSRRERLCLVDVHNSLHNLAGNETNVVVHQLDMNRAAWEDCFFSTFYLAHKLNK
jgi:hypothetical protein